MDEEEYLENLFDCLCIYPLGPHASHWLPHAPTGVICVLQENKKYFTQAEGLKLLQVPHHKATSAHAHSTRLLLRIRSTQEKQRSSSWTTFYKTTWKIAGGKSEWGGGGGGVDSSSHLLQMGELTRTWYTLCRIYEERQSKAQKGCVHSSHINTSVTITCVCYHCFPILIHPRLILRIWWWAWRRASDIHYRYTSSGARGQWTRALVSYLELDLDLYSHA